MDANAAPGVYAAWWSMVEAVYEACDNAGHAPGAGWETGFRPCLQSDVPVEETAPVHFVRQ